MIVSCWLKFKIVELFSFHWPSLKCGLVVGNSRRGIDFL